MTRLWIATKVTIILTLITGIIYPLAMVAIARELFPGQAGGSLISHDERVVGSAIIGQNFASPKYFHSRPSAAGSNGYDASNSGGSNLGPTNKSLIDAVQQRVKQAVEDNSVPADQIPVDLVTASGSGLDPEISPAAAEVQVARVAKARGLDEGIVRAMVEEHTRARWAGVLGEPGVNVLELNLALDGAKVTE